MNRIVNQFFIDDINDSIKQANAAYQENNMKLFVAHSYGIMGMLRTLYDLDIITAEIHLKASDKAKRGEYLDITDFS